MIIKTFQGAVALALSACAAGAIAGPVGYGAGTTGGGNKTPVTVTTFEAMQAAIDSYSGSGGLVLNYTGKFDFSSIKDVCAQWKLPAKAVQIKNKSNITIKGGQRLVGQLRAMGGGQLQQRHHPEHDHRPAAGR